LKKGGSVDPAKEELRGMISNCTKTILTREGRGGGELPLHRGYFEHKITGGFEEMPRLGGGKGKGPVIYEAFCHGKRGRCLYFGEKSNIFWAR